MTRASIPSGSNIAFGSSLYSSDMILLLMKYCSDDCQQAITPNDAITISSILILVCEFKSPRSINTISIGAVSVIEDVIAALLFAA